MKKSAKAMLVVNASLNGRWDRSDGKGDLEYWGYACDGKHLQVKIVVTVQVARRTRDKRYDAGQGRVIGVITAFCKGMTKRRDWMNQSTVGFMR